MFTGFVVDVVDYFRYNEKNKFCKLQLVILG